MSKDIEIAVFTNAAEAEMARQTLESNGVPGAIISNDSGGDALGQTFAQGVKILVKEEYAETARNLLELPASDDLSGSNWKCDNCSEEIEWQFTECWNCGKERRLV